MHIKDPCPHNVIQTPVGQAISKLSGPNSVFYLKCIPIVEWFMVRCGHKMGHEQDMCLKEIGLRA